MRTAIRKSDRTAGSLAVGWGLLIVTGLSLARGSFAQAGSLPDLPRQQLPALGTWRATLVENGFTYKWNWYLVRNRGQGFDGFEDSTQPDGPLVRSVFSLVYSPDTNQIQIDQRLTSTTAPAADIPGAVLSYRGHLSTDGKTLRDLRIVGYDGGPTTSIQWIEPSLPRLPRELEAAVLDDDPSRLLLQQMSGNYMLNTRRYLTGRDSVILTAMAGRQRDWIGEFAKATLQLDAIRASPGSHPSISAVFNGDGVSQEMLSLAFRSVASADERLAAIQTTAGLLAAPLESRFQQEVRDLAIRSLAHRLTNEFCARVESGVLPGASAEIPNSGRFRAKVSVENGSVYVELTNASGVDLHNCYVRSRLKVDDVLMNALEADHKRNSVGTVGIGGLMGLPVGAALKADQAMMDYQRLEKSFPFYVHEWRARVKLRFELGRLDPIVRIGGSSEVFICADEGGRVIPIDVKQIRADFGAGIPVGKW